MNIKVTKANVGCKNCAGPLDFDFTFSFQPIVDVVAQRVFAHEALVRGREGQGAGWVLSQITEKNRHSFDQECRTRAIQLASHLGMESYLSINFMPNAVYQPENCIRTTLETANSVGFDTKKLIFEVLESEQVSDPKKLLEIFKYYQSQGFGTAIDDFGSGYAGLTLLADLEPKFIKLDMHLVRNVHMDRVKQAILRGVIDTAKDLDIQIISEGVEQAEEAEWFIDRGVNLMQGYLFAKPAFEHVFSDSEIIYPWKL